MTKKQAMQTVLDLLFKSPEYLYYCYTEASKRPDWCMFFKPDFFISMLSSEKHMGFNLKEKIGQSNYEILKDYCAWARDNEYRMKDFIQSRWEDYKQYQINKGMPKELSESQFNFDYTFLVETFTAYCVSKKINLA